MSKVKEPISQIVNGKRVIVKKPELLAPAGNLEKLKIAVQYGADAVFIGGQEYGLRSNADNFTFEEMKEGVEFAKKYGAKVYVTTNIIAHNENIAGLEEYILGLKNTGIHGIIVADPLIIETCRRIAPEIEIHIKYTAIDYLIGKRFNFGKKKVLNVLFLHVKQVLKKFVK